MRYAILTETYPPEINGVALTVGGLEHGLRARGHEVSLIRPRQPHDAVGAAHELLVRGMALPRYPGLRFGFPAMRKLTAHWQGQPPDAIYVSTEGPLGWSAVRAARRLGIPVATGFHTRFDQYMRDYGVAPLAPFVRGCMRRFHNRTDATHRRAYPGLGRALGRVQFSVRPHLARGRLQRLAWLLIPFSASVAVSRVVLGLHYPTDVLAATGAGITLAAVSLWLVPGVALFV